MVDVLAYLSAADALPRGLVDLDDIRASNGLPLPTAFDVPAPGAPAATPDGGVEATMDDDVLLNPLASTPSLVCASSRLTRLALAAAARHRPADTGGASPDGDSDSASRFSVDARRGTPGARGGTALRRATSNDDGTATPGRRRPARHHGGGGTPVARRLRTGTADHGGAPRGGLLGSLAFMFGAGHSDDPAPLDDAALGVLHTAVAAETARSAALPRLVASTSHLPPDALQHLLKGLVAALDTSPLLDGVLGTDLGVLVGGGAGGGGGGGGGGGAAGAPPMRGAVEVYRFAATPLEATRAALVSTVFVLELLVSLVVTNTHRLHLALPALLATCTRVFALASPLPRGDSSDTGGSGGSGGGGGGGHGEEDVPRSCTTRRYATSKSAPWWACCAWRCVCSQRQTRRQRVALRGLRRPLLPLCPC